MAKISVFSLKDFFKHVFALDRVIDKRIAKISQDPEKQEKSVYFGVLSVIFLVIAVGLTFCLPWISRLCFQIAFTNLGFFTYFLLLGNLFFIVAGIAVVAVPFMLSVYALMFAIAQRRVNKKAFGVVMIVICSIGILATIALTIFCCVTGTGLFAPSGE